MKREYEKESLDNYLETTIKNYQEVKQHYLNNKEKIIIYYGFEILDDKIRFVSFKDPVYIKNTYKSIEDINISNLPKEVTKQVFKNDYKSNLIIYAATVDIKFNIEQQEEVIYSRGIPININLKEMN